jgi:hypothetical protein
VKALRGALVAIERGCISAYSAAVFASYFGDDLDKTSAPRVAGRTAVRVSIGSTSLRRGHVVAGAEWQ